MLQGAVASRDDEVLHPNEGRHHEQPDWQFFWRQRRTDGE